MKVTQLFLSIQLLFAIQEGLARNINNCNCSDFARNLCGKHGECYYWDDNCRQVGCSCFDGWTGETCDDECTRNCHNGICIINRDRQTDCSCSRGFTSQSNCTQREPTASISKPENHQTDRRWLIFLAVIPFSILGFSALIFYQLWRHRVLFALRIVRYFQWQSHDDNKEYDAFVSFRSCANDEPWVLNTLIPKLEEEIGFRLCIHLRDFPAGELISNNIIDAIENSRRTILVISPDYVTSEWTRMEYQVAQQEMLKLRHKIIPIMFRDVNDSNSIDQCLKYILRTVTYIKWPGDTDTKEQQQFWKQLQLTMPKLASQTDSRENNKA